MPLQYRGPISFDDIRKEFGGTGQVSLSQYYRNGGRVPNDSFCFQNINGGNIPASSTISFQDFYGTTNGNTYRWFDAGPDAPNPDGYIRNSGRGSGKLYSGTNDLKLPFWTRKIQYWLWGGGGGASKSYFAFSALGQGNIDVYIHGGGSGGYKTGTASWVLPEGDTSPPELEVYVGEGGEGGWLNAGVGVVSLGYRPQAIPGGTGGTSDVLVKASGRNLIYEAASGGKGGLANMEGRSQCYGSDDACRRALTINSPNFPRDLYGAGGDPTPQNRGYGNYAWCWGVNQDGCSGTNPVVNLTQRSALSNSEHDNSGGVGLVGRAWGQWYERTDGFVESGRKGRVRVRY